MNPQIRGWMDGMITKFSLMGALGAAAFLSVPAPSLADSCPANLSALDSRVQTPELRARLSLPLASVVERAGGVEQAIARSRGALETVRARRAEAAARGGETRALDEAILIFSAQIEALQCRLGSG